ncbi:Pentatricopeptide repeat-containing protein [Arachis hypogaea]|nr:Pentatricopeptide repeat-containing protein [Arachis hypogaea]
MGITKPSCTTSYASHSDLYADVLQSAIKSRDPFVGRSVHARIIKHGLHLGVFLMNNLLNFYAKTGSFSDVHCVFAEMPLKTIFSWNTILSAYAKRGNFEAAQRVFDEIPEPDSVSWTSMIVGYNMLGRFDNAIHMFLRMISCGVSPTQFTFTNVLASCAATEALDIGRKVHSFIVKLGLSSVVPVANSLLNMYAKSGDSVMAKVVFDRMRLKDKSTWNTMISMHMHFGQLDLGLALFQEMIDPDIVSWNSIITGYTHQGHDVKALEIFSLMLNSSSSKPDKYTLGSILSACANLENLKLGKQIHAYMVRANIDISGAVRNALILMYAKAGGIEIAHRIVDITGISNLDVIAFTSLLDGFVKIGDINPARDIFDSLEFRDVVAWTAMIVGYAQNGLLSDALDLFRKMVREGPKPNNYTLAAVLSVFSSLASLGHGKQLHATAIRLQEASSISVGNALITMYSRSGSIRDARKVFKQICSNKNKLTWTCMIIALAQHGFGKDAVELFDTMLKLDIEPDQITYVGVLSACSHVGLVQQAKVAAENLLLLDPNNSGAYSALANTLSACGRWKDAAMIRKSMKDRAVKKEQGITWVQIQNKVHIFGVEDGLHPQRDAIYRMISKIWMEIKKMGFIPDTDSVLHDLDQEVKEQILRHHSEKLAIAFALLNTPGYATLRIMKNLRVCNDCHSAIKYISKLVGREIILSVTSSVPDFLPPSPALLLPPCQLCSSLVLGRIID